MPAPQLMVDTLLERTTGIRRRVHGGTAGASGLLGRSTRAAIRQGSRFAAAALSIVRWRRREELIGRRPFVVVTGGRMRRGTGLAEESCVGVPDLLLKGLAMSAQKLPGPGAALLN